MVSISRLNCRIVTKGQTAKNHLTNKKINSLNVYKNELQQKIDFYELKIKNVNSIIAKLKSEY